jgi:hypothetical protein
MPNGSSTEKKSEWRLSFYNDTPINSFKTTKTVDIKLETRNPESIRGVLLSQECHPFLRRDATVKTNLVTNIKQDQYQQFSLKLNCSNYT